MEKTILLLIFLLILSGCVSDYTTSSQPTQVYEEIPTIVEKENNFLQTDEEQPSIETKKEPVNYEDIIEEIKEEMIEEVKQKIKEEIIPEPIKKIEEPVIKEITEEKKTASQCNCSGNTYNCSDFKTHIEAQALFSCCGGASNDIHGLDKDKDGLACESLK